MSVKTIYQKCALLLLSSYPRAWRERYFAEATAILEARPATQRTLFDLYLGLLDAYIHSNLFTERKQMLAQRMYQNQLVLFCLAILGIFPWLGMQLTQVETLPLYNTIASQSTKINYYSAVQTTTSGINLAGACLILTTLIGGGILLAAALKEVRNELKGLRKLFTCWRVSFICLLALTLLFPLQQRLDMPMIALAMGPLYSMVLVIGPLLFLWTTIVGPLWMLWQARKINVSSPLARSSLLPTLLITLAMSVMTILMLLTAIERAVSLPDLGALKHVIFFDFDVACMLLLTLLAYIALCKSLHARRQLALS